MENYSWFKIYHPCNYFGVPLKYQHKLQFIHKRVQLLLRIPQGSSVAGTGTPGNIVGHYTACQMSNGDFDAGKYKNSGIKALSILPCIFTVENVE